MSWCFLAGRCWSLPTPATKQSLQLRERTLNTNHFIHLMYLSLSIINSTIKKLVRQSQMLSCAHPQFWWCAPLQWLTYQCCMTSSSVLYFTPQPPPSLQNITRKTEFTYFPCYNHAIVLTQVLFSCYQRFEFFVFNNRVLFIHTVKYSIIYCIYLT